MRNLKQVEKKRGTLHQKAVEEGQIAGEVIYSLNGEWIGSVPLLYEESVMRVNYLYALKKIMKGYLL